MAELTAEVVRAVVKEVINGEIDGLRQEMKNGFERVLDTIRSLTDEDRAELAGVKGRLHNHNERIAALERLNHLRKHSAQCVLLTLCPGAVAC